MNYRIFLVEDRVPFLVKALGDKVGVVETDENGLVTVDVVIESAFDLLQVFHAGVEVGMERVKVV